MKNRCRAALTLLIAALTLSGCAQADNGAGSTPNKKRPDRSGPSVTCTYTKGGDASAKPVDPPDSKAPNTGTVAATLQLKSGTVTVRLDRSKAPCAVNNFESLASQGYFDNTACHRLVDSGIYVLQCGDPTGTGTGGPGYTFADELTGKETYTTGTVAMANAGPNTNGSQFFLVYKDSTNLDPNYTVLGTMDEVSTGVVTAIADQGQDGAYGSSGRPIANATIEKATLG